jgi:predicted nucleic acid-binding protein
LPLAKARENKMIVLDANILVRAALGLRVRELLQDYSERGIRFFAPRSCFVEAETYIPSLLQRKGRPESDVEASYDFLRKIVQPVELDSYKFFESEARNLLRRRDEDDWPVLAAALALHCPIWTEDTDFFGTGCAVWTTKNVELFLEKQIKTMEREEE